MFLLFGVEHLLRAGRFLYFTRLPGELAPCGCGWPSCNPSPSHGPSGLSLPRRKIGSRNCGEGSGRCSSRCAPLPGRRPEDPGPEPWGERQLSMSRPGTAPPPGGPGAGRRGGARRGGARGAGRRRGGGTGSSGSAHRGSPAPRAESVWRRRAPRSRRAKSGAKGPVPPPPPPDARPASEPAAPVTAADGVHLSSEPAGEAGARERSAGRSPASPGRSSAARQLRPGGAVGPAQPAWRPGRCSAPRAAEIGQK